MKLTGEMAKERLLNGFILLGVLSCVGAVAFAWHQAEAARAVKPSSSVAEVQTKAVAKQLKLGAAAPLGGDYSVAVNKLILSSDENGPLLVAQVKAQYLGKGRRDPRNDLVVGFLPAGSDEIRESACGASLAGISKLPPAGKGAQTYTACIELPTSAVEGGTIFVEAADNKAFWTADHVTTSRASLAPPTAPPTGPATAPAVSEKVRQEQLHDVKKQLKKLKKLRDQVDDQIDVYENTPDHSKKDLKKLKKTRDNTDDAIDQFEKMKKQLGG